MTIRFIDKDPGGEITVEFNFSDDATTVTTPEVTISVFYGTDPDVASMLVGSPSVIGAKVLQRVRAGVSGVDYNLQCFAFDGNDRLDIDAILPVRARPVSISATPVYLTEAEFEQRFGDRELAELLSDGNAYLRAENDAASLIDGYLAARYTLPLVSVPNIVKGWAGDIARFKLWDEAAPEEVRKRYEDALAQLKLLAQGVINLPPDAAGTPPVSGGAFDGYSNERVFTADSLSCF